MITNYETSEGIGKANELCVGLKMSSVTIRNNLRRHKIKKALQLQNEICEANDLVVISDAGDSECHSITMQELTEKIQKALYIPKHLLGVEKESIRKSVLDNIVLRPNQEAFV